MKSQPNRSYKQVPVAEIRALFADVERTHDAYWIEPYDHASTEATLRRNDWLRAVRDYETALKHHAEALLEIVEAAREFRFIADRDLTGWESSSDAVRAEERLRNALGGRRHNPNADAMQLVYKGK